MKSPVYIPYFSNPRALGRCERCMLRSEVRGLVEGEEIGRGVLIVQIGVTRETKVD